MNMFSEPPRPLIKPSLAVLVDMVDVYASALDIMLNEIDNSVLERNREVISKLSRLVIITRLECILG